MQCQDSSLRTQERQQTSMRRRRFQNPEPKKRQHGRHWVWVGQYRDIERVSRTVVLGKCSEISKGEAEAKLASILAPVNAGAGRKHTTIFTFQEFVNSVYLPLARRRWKASTAMTTEPSIQLHLVQPLGLRFLSEISREDLQSLLDQKARCFPSVGSSQVVDFMERETGLEPATSSLGSWHSTTELLPPAFKSAI